ncbi:Hypothetical protein A7982_11304 [Minicystis rosea]|nr:Hypothetical protein A7982_11304 [Minicystis rosea]
MVWETTMKRRSWFTGAAILAGLLGGAREARADIALSGDVALGVPVDQAPQRYLSTGAGFDLRAGYRFRIPYQSVAIIPELAVGYTDLGAHLVRVRPGLRVGIGRILVPYLYGHVGWGFTSFNPLGDRDTTGTASFVSAQGLALDVGAGLDVAILRRLSVGAHVGYNVVNVGSTDRTPLDWRAQWMSFGLSATLHL